MREFMAMLVTRQACLRMCRRCACGRPWQGQIWQRAGGAGRDARAVRAHDLARKAL